MGEKRVGWNIEIMFMFATLGIVYYHSLNQDRNAKILGIPDMWFWAIDYSAFFLCRHFCHHPESHGNKIGHHCHYLCCAH